MGDVSPDSQVGQQERTLQVERVAYAKAWRQGRSWSSKWPSLEGRGMKKSRFYNIGTGGLLMLGFQQGRNLGKSPRRVQRWIGGTGQIRRLSQQSR